MNILTVFGIFLPCAQAHLAAQVAVIPSIPPYNIQVLPGSTRQINVNIAGGSLNTVNWSILSTTGGATATFTAPAASGVSSVSAGIPTVQVNIGPGTGNCTIPQPQSAVGTYTVTSTATVTVQAQSVDDPTKTGTFLFNVCAKTTTVLVAPAYQQAYQGQHRMLQSWVSGDTDETGTWSIVAQPGGGDGILADTTNRDTDFVATATGRYTLQYTSHSNPSKSATAIVYVSPNPMPAYLSTPNKTEPRECYADPALTGGDYEVGAGKQYPTLQSTPPAGSLAPGSIIRVWNTDTTGSNPSTYHEYYQIASTGTPTQPMILCGVPDSLGNLPVLDGANATGQAGVTTDGAAAGAGIVSVFAGGYGNGAPYGYWQSGSAGPSYVTVTGLHLVHGTPDYNYIPPGGGSPTPYEAFTACLNIRSGSYIDLGGNNMDTCDQGLYTDDNGNEGWAAITQLVTLTGSHIQMAGLTGGWGEHEAYFSTWYGLIQGNLWDNYNPAAAGSAIKWRGVEGIFRYNNIASGAARLFDLVDIEDATNYIAFESYLGPQGDSNCDDSMYCLGDAAGPNVMAAFQESFQKDFIYGNELYGRSATNQIHYLADGASGMQDRNGTLYFFNNTLDAAQDIFDTGTNGDGFYGYFPQRIDARNNILWGNVPSYNGLDEMFFGSESTIVMSATTNLMKAGTFTVQTPIEGASWGDATQEGWSNSCDGVCQWPLAIPLNTHLYGLSDANYLTTATQPYNPVTMVPPAGSAAIDAGSPLSGILQTMPVRWQYSIASNSLIPRLNPQTIGAVDFAPEAATPAFSPVAGQYNTAQNVTIGTATPSASIYYTTDGSIPTYPATGTTQLYTGPIAVSSTETLQAIATANGYVQSGVGAASYGIGPLAATPTFSPAAGTYTAVQTVAIGDTTAGAAIHYTTDGSTPTASSPLYRAPIAVSTNETVQAIATAAGYSNSNAGSAAYTINIPQTATPTFTPAGGTYTSTQTVTIADASPGAAIFYTADGSTPTAASQAYTGAIAVSASETLQAIAIAPGDSPSAVASATYAIALPFAGPVFAQQCNNFLQYGTTVSCTLNGVGAGDTLAIGVANLTSNQPGIATSTSGTPFLVTTDGISLSSWILPNASAGSITISYSVASTTRLWLSVSEYSNTAASPLDGSAQAVVSSWQGNGEIVTPNFTTTSTSDVLWSFCMGVNGAATVGTDPTVWTARPTPAGGSLLVEDGNVASPGTYYGQCAANEGEIVTLALMPPPVLPAATPTFSVPAGSYSSAQTVSIADATPGATIYYTANGAAPTTASAVYSGPIGVSTSETVRAIAVANGFSQSSVGSAAYTISSVPAIAWTTPAPIQYGTALSAAQLNATSPVAGSFAYSPAAGTVLAAGTQTLNVAFTPADTTDYTTATASVTLTVIKASPSIVWATPAPIAYGTALSKKQLNATSPVAGTFAYSPALGTVLGAGTQTLTATFTPANTAAYGVSTASVTLQVNPATLTVTARNATMTYGANLPLFTSSIGGFVHGDTSATALTGAPSLTTAANSQSPVGDYTIDAGLGTLSAANYLFSFKNGKLAIGKANLIASATNFSIPYGSAIPQLACTLSGFRNGDTQASSTTGAPALSTGATSTSAVGSYPIAIAEGTLEAANYNFALRNGTLKIVRAVPAIDWNAPTPISFGTPLGSVQQNATSPVAGSFTYSPAADTVLAAGTHTLAATFTPADAGNYETARASVVLTVTEKAQSIVFTPLPSPVNYGVKPIALSATSTSGLPVVYSASGPAKVSGSTLTVTGAGTVTVTANQAGNSNYGAAAGVTQTVVVQPERPAVAWATPAAIVYGKALSSTQLDAKASVAGTFVYTPAAGTVLAAGTQTLSATFTPSDTIDFTSATAAVQVTVNKAAAAVDLTQSAKSATAGTPVAFTATLTGTGAIPTGSVSFLDGATPLGTGTLNGNGVASFTASFPTAGKHTITASYQGDAYYLAGASEVSLTVSAH